MSLAVALRNLKESPFPIEPGIGLSWRPWFRHYPSDVPRGLVYPALRAEQLLLCAARRYPDRLSVDYYRTRWTYQELCERVRRVAANLARLGVRTGDRVMIALPNSPEFVVAWFAAHWLGAQVVPANPLYSSHELVRLAQLARARVVLALDLKLDPVFEATRRHPIPLVIVCSLASHLPIRLRWPYLVKNWLGNRAAAGTATTVLPFEVLYENHGEPIADPVLSDAGQPAVLQPTGGTTGTPKVAVLTHLNLLANVAQLHVWSGLKPGSEVVLAVLPFFHVFGSTVGLLSSIAGGATLVLQARFDPPNVCKVMEKCRPTVAPMVPFMFTSLCQEMRRRGKNISGLRVCLSGASALDPAIRAEFSERTGAVIFEGYGLSEASPVTHGNPPDATARPGTIGMPLPDTDARVVDVETGETDLQPGDVGELIVRGPQVMAGYLDEPAETAQVLRDGWLYTGDLARMDENGFFTLVDRKKDMIKSGGLNIYPSEVEKVLGGHAAVRECAVVGVADPLFGERLVAYVVPSDGVQIDPAQLQAYCRAELASYKVPRTIEVCDRLPTNFLGKVRRVELRTRAAETPAGPPLEEKKLCPTP